VRQPAIAEEPKAARLRAEAAWELAGEGVARDFARGRFEEALEALETRIGRGYEEGWVYALRSELKRSPRLDMYGEALEDAERACALSPQCFWIWGYAARAFAQARRPEQTLKHLEKALALEPECPWLLVERSLVQLRQGRRAEALADAGAACRLDPSSTRARLARAECLSALGKFDEALEALDGSDKLSDDRSLVGTPGPMPHELRFNVLRGLKRFTDAAQSLKKAAASGQRLTWALPEAGAQALGDCLREISLVTGSPILAPWLGFWRGEILLRLKRFDEAEVALGGAVAADGKLFFTRAWRGWCRSLAGKTDQALEDVDAALSLMDQASPWAGQLLSLKGSLCAGLGRSADAESALTKALENGGPQAWVRLTRAQARLALGKAEQAAIDLDEALDADPAYGKAYVLRAQLRTRRGNLEGARSDLYRAKSVGKPRGDRPDLSLSFPAVALAEGKRRPPAPVARRLGAVAVEPMIELVGLMQAVLDPKPFHIDEVSPLGEDCGSRDPHKKMNATAGLKEGPAIAKDMLRYAEEAVKLFAPRVDAPMRKTFQTAVAIQGNAASPWYGLSQMMMSVTGLPEMRAEGPEWRHPENLRLLESFRSFAGRSGFLAFLSDNKASFSKWTKAIKETVAKEPYSEAVASYVGVDINAYYDVVLSPLLRDVTLCAILKSNGLRGARTVICPLTHVSEFYRAYDKDYLLWRGWHEILHMVVDRWTELHIDGIAPLSRLHELPQGGAKRHDWRDCVAEHMVRAVTQRILGIRRGAQAMEVLAGRDRLEGYVFQDRFVAALSAYESSRKVYPTLLDFFPEWLKVLQQWP
jgi:tetratricopeptide (TPR) repeat protein